MKRTIMSFLAFIILALCPSLSHSQSCSNIGAFPTYMPRWYSHNLIREDRLNRVINVVRSGVNVIALEKVYVRNDGEHSWKGSANIGVHVWDYRRIGWIALPVKVHQVALSGARYVGEEDNDRGPKWEWDDCEGSAYFGLGIASLGTGKDQISGTKFKIKLIEGDEFGDDVIFDKDINISDLTNNRILKVDGNRPNHATIWLRLYPVFPPPHDRGTNLWDHSKTIAWPVDFGDSVPLDEHIIFNDPVEPKAFLPRTPTITPRGLIFNPSDKVLVGIRTYWGRMSINAVIPIFKSVKPDGTLGSVSYGLTHGTVSGDLCDLYPKGDFVVTGLVLNKTSDRLNGIRIKYKKWLGNWLLGQSIYEARTICDNKVFFIGRKEIILPPDRIATGLKGTTPGNGGRIVSLGLLTAIAGEF